MDRKCTNVRFVPRATQSGVQTPDIEATCNGLRVLCEVKTISISDNEVVRRQSGGVGTTQVLLKLEFLKKLQSTLEHACQQLCTYDSSTAVQRFAFLIVNFDDSFAEYKVDYYCQIDAYLASHKFPQLQLKIVFFIERTVFHAHVAMHHAEVVNEATR